MKPMSVVLDTNVLVAAARSQRGASFALLQTLPSGKWRTNLSPALLLEHEAKFKTEALRQGRPQAIVDRFLDFLASVSDRLSLDRLIVVALVEKLAAMFPDEALEERAKRGTLQGFREFIQGVPDVEPPAFDQLPKLPQPGK